MTPEDFAKLYDKTDGCWIWRGAPNGSGYGSLRFKGSKIGAHRASYEIHFGPFDRRLFVLHRCDNPRCVNPQHLFLGTQTDNMKDCASKGRLENCYRWTAKDNPNKGKPMSAKMRCAVSGWKQRPFSFVSPKGDVVHGSNLTQFCKDNGLNQGAMWCVMRGQRKSHKGYTKAP